MPLLIIIIIIDIGIITITITIIFGGPRPKPGGRPAGPRLGWAGQGHGGLPVSAGGKPRAHKSLPCPARAWTGPLQGLSSA